MKPRAIFASSRLFLFLLAVASFLVVSIPVLASQDAKDKLYENDGQRHICSAVKNTIEEGMSSLDVVRTAIELGNSPCLIVKCAIYGGGDLKQIIEGAIQAGATSDVVSRCAIDAGADSREVSAALKQTGLSLCYFEPEGLPYTPPGDNPPPFQPVPTPNPNPPISPSTF